MPLASAEYPGWPDLPAPAEPWMDTLYARTRSHMDPRHFAMFVDQKAPKGFRSLPSGRPRRPFPGTDYVLAEAYFFDTDRQGASPGEITLSRRGCGAVIAPDGTLCPTVMIPPTQLDDVAAQELVDIAETREPTPIASMCGFSPDVGVVFRDAGGRPVGEIVIDYRCVAMNTRPPVKTRPPGEDRVSGFQWLGSARRTRLSDLLLRANVRTAPLSPEQQQALVEQGERDRHMGRDYNLARLLPPASGLDVTRRVSDLTDREWQRVCAWQSQLWRHSGFMYGCEDGSRELKVDYAACDKQKQRCAASVGEIETCARYLRFDNPCFERPRSDRCVELRDCLPGWKLAVHIR